jgi:hypothetical protein
VIITLAVAIGMGLAAWQLGFNEPIALTAAILVGCYPQNLLRIATLAQLLAIKLLAKKRLWVKYPAAIDALGRIAIIVLVLESDTTLNIEDLSPSGISWQGLIRLLLTMRSHWGRCLASRYIAILTVRSSGCAIGRQINNQ